MNLYLWGWCCGEDEDGRLRSREVFRKIAWFHLWWWFERVCNQRNRLLCIFLIFLSTDQRDHWGRYVVFRRYNSTNFHLLKMISTWSDLSSSWGLYKVWTLFSIVAGNRTRWVLFLKSVRWDRHRDLFSVHEYLPRTRKQSYCPELLSEFVLMSMERMSSVPL